MRHAAHCDAGFHRLTHLGIRHAQEEVLGKLRAVDAIVRTVLDRRRWRIARNGSSLGQGQEPEAPAGEGEGI